MIAPTPPRALEQIIAIGIFLAGTFAGDYLLGPIPAMWLIVLAALVFLRQRPSQREWLAAIILLVLFLPGTVLHFSSDRYFYSGLNAALYVYILILLRRIYDGIEDLEPLLFWLVLLIYAVFHAIPVEYTTSNVRIFGPNIQYRVYGLLYLFYLVAFVHAQRGGRHPSHLRLSIMFMAMGLAMLETGSRTALFVSGLCAMLSCGLLMRSGTWIKVSLLSLLAALLTWTSLDFLRDRFFRSFLIDFREDLSAQVRFDMYELAKDFWSTDVLTQMFGMGPHNPIFPFYPHNIGLELLVYWGLLVLAAFAVLSARAAWRMLDSPAARDWHLLFMPILIGVWVSGDLGDNFAALSFCVFVAMGLHAPSMPHHHYHHHRRHRGGGKGTRHARRRQSLLGGADQQPAPLRLTRFL